MDIQTISKIKAIVAELSSSERQHYLSRFLAQTHRLKQATDTTQSVQLVDDYIEIFDELVDHTERKTYWNVNADCTHVHIVFGDSADGYPQFFAYPASGIFTSVTYRLERSASLLR